MTARSPIQKQETGTNADTSLLLREDQSPDSDAESLGSLGGFDSTDTEANSQSNQRRHHPHTIVGFSAESSGA